MQVSGNRDLKVARAVAGVACGAPVEIDQRGELRRRQPDIGQRQRQSERPRPDHAALGSAGADPDRQARLQRPRRDRCIAQGRTKAPLPGDALGRVEPQQQVELLGEQRILVRQVVAEQRERLVKTPRPAITSARPPDSRSTVAKSSNTRTGSAVGRMVTALASRTFVVTCAIAASTTGVAAIAKSSR